jgi:hypothetical protein
MAMMTVNAGFILNGRANSSQTTLRNRRYTLKSAIHLGFSIPQNYRFPQKFKKQSSSSNVEIACESALWEADLDLLIGFIQI